MANTPHAAADGARGSGMSLSLPSALRKDYEEDEEVSSLPSSATATTMSLSSSSLTSDPSKRYAGDSINNKNKMQQDMKVAWQWFRQTASKNDNKSVSPKTVAAQLQCNRSSHPNNTTYSSASAKCLSQPLWPCTFVATHILRKTKQLQQQHLKIRVYLKLLHAPTSWETPWKAVTELLRHVLGSQTQQATTEENDDGHWIVREIQAFWSEAISVWAEENKRSLETNSNTRTTPRDFILEWISLLLPSLYPASVDVAATAEGWTSSSPALQLLVSLFRSLSFNVVDKHELDWVLDAIFSCSERAATNTNDEMPRPKPSSPPAKVYTELALWLRRDDWESGVRCARQTICGGGATATATTDLSIPEQKHWAFHLTQWLLLQSMHNVTGRVSETITTKGSSGDDNDLEIQILKLLSWLLPAGQDVVRNALVHADPDVVAHWTSQIALSWNATVGEDCDDTNDAREEHRVSSLQLLLVLWPGAASGDQTTKAIWGFLNRFANHGADDETTGVFSKQDDYKDLERILEGDTFDQFLSSIAYTGKGIFVSLIDQEFQRQQKQGHTTINITTKQTTGDSIATKQSRVGRLVSRQLKRCVIAAVHSSNKYVHSSSNSGDGWLDLLDPEFFLECLEQNCEVMVRFAALVTWLAEATLELRLKWTQRITNLLHQERVKGERLSPSCMLGLGALYLVHSHMSSQPQKEDPSYHRQLSQLLQCAFPSHPVVRALLPRRDMRFKLLELVQSDWLAVAPPSRWSEAFQRGERGLINNAWKTHFEETSALNELGLWTLLQLVMYHHSDHSTTINGKQNGVFWRALCKFMLEGLPPVPGTVRSWFWDQALLDCLRCCEQQQRNLEETNASLVDKLHRVILLRFFQLVHHPVGSPQYCALSLDRLFVVTTSSQLVPSEALVPMFACMLRSSPELMHSWTRELVELLGTQSFVLLDKHTAAMPSSVEDSYKQQQLEEESLLCARVILHCVAGTSGIEQSCSFSQIRHAICGDDELLTKANGIAKKRLTSSELSPDQSTHLGQCVRAYLAEGLLEILLSTEVFESTASHTTIVGCVCGLVETVQSLTQQAGEAVQTTLFSPFADPEERILRLVEQSFPRLVSLVLPLFSCIISRANKSHQLPTRSNDSSITNEAKPTFLREASLIVASIIYFCKEFQCVSSCKPKGFVVRDRSTFGSILQSLDVLYDTFCTKKALGTLSHYLEQEQGEMGGRNPSTSDTRPGVEAPLLGLESPADIDKSTRRIRKTILGVIQQCLKHVRAPSQSSFLSEDGQGLVSEFDFVNRIMNNCCRDIREGLQGASGGLGVEEYLAFLECIEVACERSLTINPLLTIEERKKLLQTCNSVARFIEDVVCSIALRNRNLMKRTLQLCLQKVPTAIDELVKQLIFCTDDSDVASLTPSLTLRLFEQCYCIAEKWVCCSSPGVNWSSIVDPGHLRASWQLGDLSENEESDEEVEIVRPDLERCNSAAMDVSSPKPEKRGNKTLIQLESCRSWTWAFSAVLGAFGSAMEVSSSMISQEQPEVLQTLVMETYVAYRFQIFEEVFKAIGSLFRATRADCLAASLHPSTKSAFRFLLEKTTKALSQALLVLGSLVAKHQQQRMNTVLGESLACILAWTRSTQEAPDLCNGIRLWSFFESRANNRVKHDNNVLVANKSDMAKRLEKAMTSACDVEQALEALNIKFQHGPREEHTWDKFVSLVKGTGAAATFPEVLASKRQQLQNERALYGDKLGVPTSSRTSAIRGDSKTMKKRRSSSDQPAVRKSHKERGLQSRNVLVRGWLEMDRNTGREETFQEDAYADLEDFLVDG